MLGRKIIILLILFTIGSISSIYGYSEISDQFEIIDGEILQSEDTNSDFNFTINVNKGRIHFYLINNLEIEYEYSSFRIDVKDLLTQTYFPSIDTKPGIFFPRGSDNGIYFEKHGSISLDNGSYLVKVSYNGFSNYLNTSFVITEGEIGPSNIIGLIGLLIGFPMATGSIAIMLIFLYHYIFSKTSNFQN